MSIYLLNFKFSLCMTDLLNTNEIRILSNKDFQTEIKTLLPSQTIYNILYLCDIIFISNIYHVI